MVNNQESENHFPGQENELEIITGSIETQTSHTEKKTIIFGFLGEKEELPQENFIAQMYAYASDLATVVVGEGNETLLGEFYLRGVQEYEDIDETLKRLREKGIVRGDSVVTIITGTTNFEVDEVGEDGGVTRMLKSMVYPGIIFHHLSRQTSRFDILLLKPQSGSVKI